MGSNHSLVFFDGICNLCNHSVQFIINRDPGAQFKFAPLQSDIAQQTLLKSNGASSSLDSIVLVEDGKMYTESTAALLIARKLTGLWPMFYVFILVPPFIRDVAYRWIARNRYRWFGKNDHCMVPRAELKERFIG